MNNNIINIKKTTMHEDSIAEDLKHTNDELCKIEEELSIREEVLSALKKQKSVSATAAERGKIDICMDNVEHGIVGWKEHPKVKPVLKSIYKRKAQEKQQQELFSTNASIDKLIDAYNFQSRAAGSGGYMYQSIRPDEFGVREWIEIKKDGLRQTFPQLNVHLSYKTDADDTRQSYDSLDSFNTKLLEKGSQFTKIIQSYKDIPECLNIMNKHCQKASEDNSDDYHWIVDACFESLSGATPGELAFESFVTTLWAKYLHPENPFIPNYVIRDKEGRAGKDLFANTFLKRLFAGNVAQSLTIDQVLGNFNDAIAGKAIAVINESTREKVDNEKLKSVVGSPSVLINGKYQIPYRADNTALYMFFSNNHTGAINVSGTQSDKRFNFYNVKVGLYKTIVKYFKQLENKVITEEEAQAWIENRGQHILFGEEAVSKWITSCALKYGDIQTVANYHGDEYNEIVDIQRGAWTQTVENVFNHSDFKYIRVNLLIPLIREYNKGEKLPGKTRMKEEIDRLIKDKNLPIEFKDRVIIGDNQFNVYRRIGQLSFTPDESLFCERDEYGRIIWKWEE